jgi:aryl-alcohol dehydrogenase-like predicted oxidoreductase
MPLSMQVFACSILQIFMHQPGTQLATMKFLLQKLFAPGAELQLKRKRLLLQQKVESLVRLWKAIGRDAQEHYLYRAVEASAAKMGVSTIKLWQHHRLNHHMPFEEQFENVMKLKAHGIVQNIGVSNYTAEQLRRAIKIGGTPKQGGVVSVQNEWSPRSRAWADVRDICIEYGIAFLPWSPLGGIDIKDSLENGSYDAFAEVAKAHNVSKFAIAIAWHLATSPVAIPIPGASRKESILDSLTGLDVKLSAAELEQLNASLPANPPLADELVPQPPFRD